MARGRVTRPAHVNQTCSRTRHWETLGIGFVTQKHNFGPSSVGVQRRWLSTANAMRNVSANTNATVLPDQEQRSPFVGRNQPSYSKPKQTKKKEKKKEIISDRLLLRPSHFSFPVGRSACLSARQFLRVWSYTTCATSRPCFFSLSPTSFIFSSPYPYYLLLYLARIRWGREREIASCYS